MSFSRAIIIALSVGLTPAAAVAQGAPAAQPGMQPGSPTPWQYPRIKGHGRVLAIPSAADQPDPMREYRLVFSIQADAPRSPAVNSGLDHVARAVNLFALAKVPSSHVHIVAVVFGDATHVVLDDAHHRSVLHGPNPNLDLIHQLRKAGVQVYVCGQAMAEHGFERGWIDPAVRVTLSGLFAVADYQLKGYALEQY